MIIITITKLYFISKKNNKIIFKSIFFFEGFKSIIEKV